MLGNLKSMPVHRSLDSLGPYYQWGHHGHKYHYTPGNRSEREQAKKRAHLQARAAYSHGYKGGALADHLPEFIRNRLPTLRLQAPPNVRAHVQKMKGIKITSVRVCRTPLQSHIFAAMNLLSLGHFDRARKALGYDNIFHLFMVLHFANGQTLRLDKNQVLHLSNGREAGDVWAAGSPNTDLGEFLARGEQVAGAHSYWVYSPHKDNCQKFVIDSLQGNGLLTPALRNFVYQDADKLLPPGIVRTISNALTGIATRTDRIIHGEGRFLWARKTRR